MFKRRASLRLSENPIFIAKNPPRWRLSTAEVNTLVAPRGYIFRGISSAAALRLYAPSADKNVIEHLQRHTPLSVEFTEFAGKSQILAVRFLRRLRS